MPSPEHGTDTYIYKYVVNPVSKKTCNWFTPNMITTVGIVVSFYLAKNIAFNNDLDNAIILTLLMYLLDMFDGGLARKCDMGSSFGAKYDVISDLIKVVLIFVGIMLYSKRTGHITPAILIGLLYVIGQFVGTKKSFNVNNPYKKRHFFHDNSLLSGILFVVSMKLFCNK